MKRNINTRWLNHGWFLRLSSNAKLLWFVLLNAQETGRTGLCDADSYKIAFYSSLSEEDVIQGFKDLYPRVLVVDDFIWIPDFVVLQGNSPSWTKGAQNEWMDQPVRLRNRLLEVARQAEKETGYHYKGLEILEPEDIDSEVPGTHRSGGSEAAVNHRVGDGQAPGGGRVPTGQPAVNRRVGDGQAPGTPRSGDGYRQKSVVSSQRSEVSSQGSDIRDQKDPILEDQLPNTGSSGETNIDLSPPVTLTGNSPPQGGPHAHARAKGDPDLYPREDPDSGTRARDEGKVKKARPRIKSPPCPCDEIVAMFNRLVAGNGSVPEYHPQGSLPKALLKKVRARWKEHPDREWWEAYFKRIAMSPFLTGRKTDWRIDFTWPMGPENMAKILAGRYDPVFNDLVEQIGNGADGWVYIAADEGFTAEDAADFAAKYGFRLDVLVDAYRRRVYVPPEDYVVQDAGGNHASDNVVFLPGGGKNETG